MQREKAFTNFEDLRSRLLNDVYLALGIAAIPALIISISRIVLIGFQAFMLVHIFLVAGIWLIWIYRKRISYIVRASTLLVILWIATFAALSQLGPASDSKVFMILFAFTGMLFFKAKSAWALVAGIIISMACFGYAAVQHWIEFKIDYEAYSHHPLPWVVTIWNMGVFSTIVAYIGWRMIHGLREQSENVSKLADRLQKISERVPGVVFQYKMLPDGTSSFPYTSSAVEEIYRVKPEELKHDASKVLDVIHPDDKKMVLDSISVSAENLTPWKLEYRVKFGEDVQWLTGSAIPQREDDGSILWHGVITDVTERKKTEQIKNEFISTVSHELRTPLTSIRGSIRMVNSGALDSHEDKKQKMLNIAEQNTERLLFLINDLLDMEKLEDGNIVISKSMLNSKDFFNECVAENQSYAEEHNTTIELQQCDEMEFLADANRLKQVMANLISNACKFSNTNDVVEIYVKDDDGVLEIDVTDHGPGIPKEFQNKVFEKFTQANASNTRMVGGTGLGLSIVKKIIELHDGSIRFTTEVGKGTTFIVQLPIMQY